MEHMGGSCLYMFFCRNFFPSSNLNCRCLNRQSTFPAFASLKLENIIPHEMSIQHQIPSWPPTVTLVMLYISRTLLGHPAELVKLVNFLGHFRGTIFYSVKHYMEIEDIIHGCKSEETIEKKRYCKTNDFSSGLKLNFKKESNIQVKLMITFKMTKPLFVRKQVATLQEKRENIAQPKHKWKIRSFQCQKLGHYAHGCPNKRSMWHDQKIDVFS